MMMTIVSDEKGAVVESQGLEDRPNKGIDQAGSTVWMMMLAHPSAARLHPPRQIACTHFSTMGSDGRVRQSPRIL
jgi:hypothetical protein